MLDGILLEKAEIPCVTIVTDLFEVTGRAMAEQWGHPGFPFLVMPHPTANLTEAELDQRAQDIAPEVARLLLGARGEKTRDRDPA